MSLADKARQRAVDHSRHPSCSVASLTAEQQAEVNDAIDQADGHALTLGDIAEQITEDWGIDIAAGTLGRHRRRGKANGCKCEPG